MRLDSSFNPIPATELDGLITRSELWSALFLHQQKEYISNLVPRDTDFLDSERVKFLSGKSIEEVLASRHWSSDDLDSHLHLSFALNKFSESLFGPGLEDDFLAANGDHDLITYSLIRVKDQGLVRELWIRLEEGETTFAEAASRFGEGSESFRNGLFGPMPIGNVPQPELAKILRSMKIGEIYPPITAGDCHILLRLESLQPARLDQDMRRQLLNSKLDELLRERVALLMRGETPSELLYQASL